MDPLGTTAPDVLCPYPVVLIVVKHIADLVRPDGVHVFIIAAHLLPLSDKEKQTKLHLQKDKNPEKKIMKASDYPDWVYQLQFCSLCFFIL